MTLIRLYPCTLKKEIEGGRVAGIICMHKLSDNRMAMRRAHCGGGFPQKLLFVSTRRWDLVKEDECTGCEAQLRNHCQVRIEFGARMIRFTNKQDNESTWEIVRAFLQATLNVYQVD